MAKGRVSKSKKMVLFMRMKSEILTRSTCPCVMNVDNMLRCWCECSYVKMLG